MSDVSDIMPNDTFNSEIDAITSKNGHDNERVSEGPKLYPMIGYREPFYFCKEHLIFRKFT